MQILYLLGREGKAFLLVVFLQIVNVLDRFGLVVHSEHVLVYSLVHTLEHGVVVGISAGHREELLYTRNAAEVHILGNLNGICAPRRNHFTAWAHIEALQSLLRHEGGVAIKPTEFVDFLLIGLMVDFSRNHMLVLSLEEENHIILTVFMSFLTAKLVQVEDNSKKKACFFNLNC